MDLDQVKTGIREQWGNTPVAELCVCLVDQLCRTDVQERSFLTHRSLLNMAGHKDVDETLLAAINVLTASRYAVFEIQGLFVDDAGAEFILETPIMKGVISQNFLIHPHTGDQVDNPKQYSIPVYVLREGICEVSGACQG